MGYGSVRFLGGLGMWRSLVAHLTGGQGVAGSNPVIPTLCCDVLSNGRAFGSGHWHVCRDTGLMTAVRALPRRASAGGAHIGHTTHILGR